MRLRGRPGYGRPMNRIERHGRGGLARLRYLDGDFQVLTPGSFVRCAVTGLDIPLPNPGGVWWTCDYQWTEPPGGCEAVDQQDPLHAGDCCYTFGPAAEIDCNVHSSLLLYFRPSSRDE